LPFARIVDKNTLRIGDNHRRSTLGCLEIGGQEGIVGMRTVLAGC